MATQPVSFLPKRGLEENIDSIVAIPGEVAITSDTHKIFVGNELGEFVPTQCLGLATLSLTNQIDGVNTVFNLSGTLSNYFIVFYNGQRLVSDQYLYDHSLQTLTTYFVPMIEDTLEIIFAKGTLQEGTAHNLPQGILSRRNLIQGVDIDATPGLNYNSFSVIEQNMEGSIWGHFYLYPNDSSIYYAGGGSYYFYTDTYSGRVPNTFDLLDSISLYESNQFSDYLICNSFTIDPNDNRKCTATFTIPGLVDVSMYFRFDYTWDNAAAIYFEMEAVSLLTSGSYTTVNFNNCKFKFNQGTENVLSDLKFNLQYAKDFKIEEEILLNMSSIIDIGNEETPLPVYATLNIESKRAFVECSLHLVGLADSGTMYTGIPDGNIVEVWNERVTVPQIFNSNTDHDILVPLNGGDIPNIGIITINAAVKTEVN